MQDSIILDRLPLLPVAGVVEWLEQELTKHELEVIFIDHLQEFTKLSDIGAYGEVSNALSPLNQLAKKTNKAIVALAHQGKAEPRDGEIDVIGSTAFKGATDALFECRKTPDGKYTIKSDIRNGANFEKLQITIDTETGDITAVAAWRAEIEDVQKRIKDYLRGETEAKTVSEIIGEVSARKAKVLKALEWGVTDNIFIATPKIERGGGFTYLLAPERDPTKPLSGFKQ
jgi:AAA domain